MQPINLSDHLKSSLYPQAEAFLPVGMHPDWRIQVFDPNIGKSRVISTPAGNYLPTELGAYLAFPAKHCTLYLERRPSYCDRGRWSLKIDIQNSIALTVDAADGFPRYYFSLAVAILEAEQWLKVRKQADFLR